MYSFLPSCFFGLKTKTSWQAKSDGSPPSHVEDDSVELDLGEPVRHVFCSQTRGGAVVVHSGGVVPLSSALHVLSVGFEGRLESIMLENDVLDVVVLGTTPWPHGMHDFLGIAVLCQDQLHAFVIDAKARAVQRAAVANGLGLHSSAVTCVRHFPGCSRDLMSSLRWAQRKRAATHSSLPEWPVDGGVASLHTSDMYTLLVLGHENGTTTFWDLSTGEQVLHLCVCVCVWGGGGGGAGGGGAWGTVREGV